MRECGIRACYKKHRGRTTRACDFSSEFKNMFNRAFQPEKPDAAWGTDTTYIWTATCTSCGQTKAEAIPATGHISGTGVMNAKAATCTDPGYTGDTCCNACGAALQTGQTIAATGHSWDAGVVTKQPAATVDGVKTFTCGKCGVVRTETIPATGPVGLPVGTQIKDKKSNGVYKVVGDGLSAEYVKPINKKKTTAVIPDAVIYKGVTCRVISVAANAFKGNKYLKKVKIGNNVVSIGKNSFYGCGKLKSITIGRRVESIGAKAFAKNTSLTKITIPASVTRISSQAFYGCKKLKSIVIQTSALNNKTIGSKAFSGTYSKATVSVPRAAYSSYKKLLRAKGMSKKAKYKKF